MPEFVSLSLDLLVVLLAGVVLLGFAWAAARVAFDLLQVNRPVFEVLRARAGSVAAVALGAVKADHDSRRDPLVHAGIVVDRKTNTWTPRGQCSRDALDVIFRR